MHEVFFRTQQVLKVENDEIVARKREHFAQHRRRQRVEQAVDVVPFL